MKSHWLDDKSAVLQVTFACALPDKAHRRLLKGIHNTLPRLCMETHAPLILPGAYRTRSSESDAEKIWESRTGAVEGRKCLKMVAGDGQGVMGIGECQLWVDLIGVFHSVRSLAPPIVCSHRSSHCVALIGPSHCVLSLAPPLCALIGSSIVCSHWLLHCVALIAPPIVCSLWLLLLCPFIGCGHWLLPLCAPIVCPHWVLKSVTHRWVICWTAPASTFTNLSQSAVTQQHGVKVMMRLCWRSRDSHAEQQSQAAAWMTLSPLYPLGKTTYLLPGHTTTTAGMWGTPRPPTSLESFKKAALKLKCNLKNK